MRIGLILCQNSKYSPYVQTYKRILRDNNIEYELIIWDKFGLDEAEGHVFHKQSSTKAKVTKFIHYIQYGHFIKKICRNNKYDKLIVFTIAPAVFIFNLLLYEYKGKYILDVRDNSPLVKMVPGIVKRIIDNASFIVASSPEYNKWIGKTTVISHNIDVSLLLSEMKSKDSFPGEKAKYNIVNAGMLREGNINKKLILNNRNSKRLTFTYIGTETDDILMLKTVVREEGIQNVFFQGQYNREDITDIYRNNADFVNILRENNSINRDALPNKMYDAALAGVPIIVYDHNLAVRYYVEKYNIGLCISESDNLEEEIIKYINVGRPTYIQGRALFLSDVLTELNQFSQMIKDWLTA